MQNGKRRHLHTDQGVLDGCCQVVWRVSSHTIWNCTQPLKDGQKGFVLSMTWLNKVLARSTNHAAQANKESLDGELGPVDNTDIVLDIGPDGDTLKDEMGEPYIPMRPGTQLGEHYEVVPQEAWDREFEQLMIELARVSHRIRAGS